MRNLVTSATLIVILAGVTSPAAHAELRLPSPDREPDTSTEPGGGFLSLPPRRPAPPSEQQQPAPPPAPTSQPRPAPRPPAPVQRTQPAPAPEPVMAEEQGGGLSFETLLTTDYFSNVAGGVSSGSSLLGLWEGAVELDTGALDLWSNGTVFVHLMYAFGTSPGTYAGDLQGISNIDADGSQFRVWEAWYEQAFPYSHGSFQIGILDFNADFYVAEYGNLFLNGAFGMGTEAGESFGMSAYPETTLGMRLRFRPSPSSYFMVGTFDAGLGDDEVSPYTVSSNEGSFWVTEFGLDKGEAFSDSYYKIGLGAVYLDQAIDHFTGDELDAGETPAFAADPYDGTAGAYFLAETSVGSKLGLFFKAGKSSDENNRFSTFYSGGITYQGLIPGRGDDVIGAGFVQTRHSDAFIQYAIDQAELYFKAETTYELTYSAQITDWLVIQPDFQYVLQPSMDPTIGNAIVVGARLQLIY